MRLKNCIPVLTAALLWLLFAAACGRSLATAAGRTENTADALSSPPALRVTGTVKDSDGPVRGAVVRVQATENKTISGAKGDFTLTVEEESFPLTVTAWADGYFVGWDKAENTESELSIELKEYYTYDDPSYTWFSTESADGSASCAACMPSYDEWMADAHSQSAVNPRFLTMYNGTDVDGNRSPLTRYITQRDYGTIPIAPNKDKDYYGPGYRLDFPHSAGNCGTCHIPSAAAIPGHEYLVDPNNLSGIHSEGIFCEFCHKVGDVYIVEETGLPDPYYPGVLSMRLHRPKGDEQLFFGNFDDVTRRVSYLPLMSESEFCAPCHFGKFWDTVAYNSFGEWLESPYSDPVDGQTCQECHMPPVDYNYFVYPEKGGFIRDSSRISTHKMLGVTDQEFMEEAVTMTLETTLSEDRNGRRQVTAVVSIVNDNTGHHVPTGTPLRQMILVIRAEDEEGRPLELQSGPVLPEWCGTGDPEDGHYAGMPGRTYAKLLEDMWTKEYPTAAYWNATRVVEDSRLPAYGEDASTYVFSLPQTDPSSESPGAVIRAELWYRRAFIELMEQKGWTDPDLLMAEETAAVR